MGSHRALPASPVPTKETHKPFLSIKQSSTACKFYEMQFKKIPSNIKKNWVLAMRHGLLDMINVIDIKSWIAKIISC